MKNLILPTQRLSASPEQLAAWLQDDSPLSLTAFGQEQGFNERADVVRAADGTDLNDFWQEVQDTIRIRNADREDMISQLTYRTDEIQEEVSVPSEVDFERASEFGQPVGIKGTAKRFFRGYDFGFYDLAIRYTWMFIAEATAQQLQNNHNLALEADIKLQFRKVMQRLFNPLNGNGFTDKNEAITTFAAYNGDGEVPPRFKTNVFDGSHNHYTITGNTAVTPANLDALAAQTEEHGYTLQGGYKTVLWVSKQEATLIKTFRVANNAQYDFVPNPEYYGGAVWVPNNGSYVGGPSGRVPGEIGTYGPFHIVEEQYIPTGYLVSIVTGGADQLTNPVAYREHSNEAYRGLKVIPGQRSDYPLLDSFYRRGLGTGIRHRGAVAIMQVKANGTYSIPAAYDPLND
jgi:hypothetical protein